MWSLKVWISHNIGMLNQRNVEMVDWESIWEQRFLSVSFWRYYLLQEFLLWKMRGVEILRGSYLHNGDFYSILLVNIVFILKQHPGAHFGVRDYVLTNWGYFYCLELMQSVVVNTVRLRQNGLHFAHNIFKCIFLYENVWISLKISLKVH